MHALAFLILALCFALAGGLGIWVGNLLYNLSPLKGNMAYIIGCFVFCPAVCIAIVLSLIMPVIYFLMDIGKKE